MQIHSFISWRISGYLPLMPQVKWFCSFLFSKTTTTAKQQQPRQQQQWHRHQLKQQQWHLNLIWDLSIISFICDRTYFAGWFRWPSDRQGCQRSVQRGWDRFLGQGMCVWISRSLCQSWGTGQLGNVQNPIQLDPKFYSRRCFDSWITATTFTRLKAISEQLIETDWMHILYTNASYGTSCFIWKDDIWYKSVPTILYNRLLISSKCKYE